MSFSRITIDPAKMGGEPCIRNIRMPVSTVVRMIADGWTRESILNDWPELEQEDITEALLYAAEASRARHLPLA